MSGLNVALIIIRPIGGQQVLDQLSWNLDGGETKGLIMVSRSRNAVRADSFTQSGSFMVLRRVLVSGPITPQRKVGSRISGLCRGRKDITGSVTPLRCMNHGP